MSGGHWDYGRVLKETLSYCERSKPILELLIEIEHQLDWGTCGDTCRDCAERRVVPALREFFDGGCEDASTAIALLRDAQQNRCERCETFAREQLARAQRESGR